MKIVRAPAITVDYTSEHVVEVLELERCPGCGATLIEGLVMVGPYIRCEVCAEECARDLEDEKYDPCDREDGGIPR